MNLSQKGKTMFWKYTYQSVMAVLMILGLIAVVNHTYAQIHPIVSYLSSDHLAKAEEAFFDGSYQDAMNYLIKGLRKNPNNNQTVSVQNSFCPYETE